MLFLFTCLFLAMSCTSKMNKVARIPEINLTKEIDGTVFNLSTIADSIEYIPLETTDSSFISQIVDIQLTKDFIFIQDRILEKLLVFSRSGKFLNQIGRKGKGPGEYTSLFTFTTDPEGQNVYLYTSSDRVLNFTVRNSYINTIITRCARFEYFSMIDTLFFLYVPRPNRYRCDGYSYFLIDRGGNVVSKGGKTDLNSAKKSSIAFMNSIYKIHDLQCFWEVGQDTIFGVDGNFNMFPRYILSVKSSRVAKPDVSSPGSFDQSLKNGAFAVFSLKEADRFFCFNVVRNSKGTQLIYFKKTEKLFDVGESPSGAITNDIDGGPDFSIGYICDPSYLIDVKYINSFQKSVNRKVPPQSKRTNPSFKILDQINEYSNPVLMVVKLID